MRRLSLLALAAALAACAKDSPTSPPATQLTFGTWGGGRVQVAATDSVTEVWDGCTGGTFAGSIALDADGRFSVNGNYDPYVLPFYSPSQSMPAQLSGQVEGKTLTFAIAVNDTLAKQVLSIGPNVVVLGQPANIAICPG